MIVRAPTAAVSVAPSSALSGPAQMRAYAVDLFALEGLRLGAHSLQRAFEHGDDANAREDMALVALYGGLALANAKLGAVHGFAGPVGGMCNAPHGTVCAAFLPHVMAINVRAMQDRQPNHPALERYNVVARMLTGKPDAVAADGVRWVLNLCSALRVPKLEQFGVTRAMVADIVAKAKVASSMKGNPIALTDNELMEILELAAF